MIILAFETSCDETAAAVLDDDKILSNIIYTQSFHNKFGGVVPEIASREHLKRLILVTEKALSDANKNIKDINIVAATSSPGLIGALLIGLNFAKSISLSLNIPFIAVNHIQAHLYSTFVGNNKPTFPFISLIVSGGHTILSKVDNFFVHKILGTTLDDAAGEAFDKVAKILGLGYPGGPLIDKYATLGNEESVKFPIAKIKKGEYNFSFSGIKTSVLRYYQSLDDSKKKNNQILSDICASFQKSVIEALYNKVKFASKEFNIKNIAISGGVSANSYLRNRFLKLQKSGYKIHIPELTLNTDNAAMVGITAYYKYINDIDKKKYLHEKLLETAKPKLDYENF